MNRRPSHPHRWGGRRSTFPGLLFLAVLLAVTAGCTVPNLPAPLPPEATGTAPAPPVVGGVISIGVDDDIRGFNPYVASQWSPAGAAIAGLVLPGVFTPGATATTGLPTGLVDRVEVTSTHPFTVTYELDRRASWSDGTPIAAEDFTYLWRQMTTQTDVVSPAGYQLISSIQSADAGKTVVVVFRTPFADWRTLFSPLLPARTLKDEPGGFTTALQTGIPVAGGRYRIDGYDPVIGQITLVRNDKYWDTETTTTNVVFRAGAAGDLVDSLRRGDVQALYLRRGGSAAAALATLDATVRRRTVPLPLTSELVFNLGADRLTADLAVRQAVAAAIDPALLRTAFADGDVGGLLPATSQLTVPAAEGAPERAPAGVTDNADRVTPALAAAGYRRSGLYFRDGDGRVLTLLLGYDATDTAAAAAARSLQRRLGTAGVQLNLVAQTATDVVGPLTVASAPDLVVTTTPRSASDRARAARLLQCATGYPTVSGATVGSATATPSATGSSTPTGTAFQTVTATPTAPGSGSSSSSPPSTPTGGADAPTGGFCDDEIRSAVTTFLQGDSDGTALDAVLWRRLAVLPVGEPVATLALGPSLAGVSLPDDPAGLLWSGPLQSLPDWPPPV
ncbi:MAG: ABC transporter substrate-binding protein [Nakamurella sp.]